MNSAARSSVSGSARTRIVKLAACAHRHSTGKLLLDECSLVLGVADVLAQVSTRPAFSPVAFPSQVAKPSVQEHVTHHLQRQRGLLLVAWSWWPLEIRHRRQILAISCAMRGRSAGS